MLVASPGPTWFAPPPVPPPGAWPDASASYSVAAAGLRRLAGAGMLVAAVSAHGLLDFADGVRTRYGIGGLVQSLME